MISSGSRDIVRYTLQSYVGNMFAEAGISGRQMEAIQRLSSLRKDKFQELCHDVVNEIHRRSGVKYDTHNKMTQKFSMLSTEKFKNLVVDTLIVYYQKNPEARVEEMPAFLENLESLIETLKVDSEKEGFFERLKRLGFYNKLQEFVTYAVGFGVDKKIADHIRESLRDAIEGESCHFVECFSYPRALLQKIEGSKLFKGHCMESPSVSEEFRISKKLIFDALEREGCSQTVREELLKIIGMAIHSATIPAKKIECFESEIKAMISVLESVKHDLEGTDLADLNVISGNLADSVDKVIRKSKGEDLPEETVSSLQIHKVTLEGLANSASKIEAFGTVVKIVKELRNVFKNANSEAVRSKIEACEGAQKCL